MTFYQILWTFFFYSFAGWCCEVVFAACKTGKFVNRGFLLGPVCPIYGFGVTAAVLLIAPIQAHWLQAYLVATLVPTIIEYFVGWLADKLLHVRLWDYSGMPLNLNGYVCLLFSLVWGLACLFIVAVFHPMVLHLLAWVPTIPGWILLALFTATILTDFILTALEAAKIPKRLQAIDELERIPWSSGTKGRKSCGLKSERSFGTPWEAGNGNSWLSGTKFWKSTTLCWNGPDGSTPTY